MLFCADIRSCKTKEELLAQIQAEVDFHSNGYTDAAIKKVHGFAKDKIASAKTFEEAMIAADHFQQTVCVFYVIEDELYLEQKLRLLKVLEEAIDEENALVLAIDAIDAITYIELFGEKKSKEEIDAYFDSARCDIERYVQCFKPKK